MRLNQLSQTNSSRDRLHLPEYAVHDKQCQAGGRQASKTGIQAKTGQAKLLSWTPDARLDADRFARLVRRLNEACVYM